MRYLRKNERFQTTWFKIPTATALEKCQHAAQDANISKFHKLKLLYLCNAKGDDVHDDQYLCVLGLHSNVFKCIHCTGARKGEIHGGGRQ